MSTKKSSPEKKPKKKSFSFRPAKIPTDPGCYLFYDEKGELLYVGKAKQLRKRVSSYFRAQKASPKVSLMASKISKIETRVVDSEEEALILESNLVKEFRPRFNVLLRDDKNFLYLRITNEDIPRLEITRRIVRDGSFYVGPKTSAKKFRSTINFCQKVFQIRTCKLDMAAETTGLKVLNNPENRKLPCMDYHVKKCSAPCTEDISTQDYAEQVQLMKKFLRGDTREVLKSLKERMMRFAQDKNFEAAAKMRDLINSVEASTQKQSVQFPDLMNRDFVQFHRVKKQAFFVRLAFRDGKMLDQNEVVFRADTERSDEEVVEQFLLQFYPHVDEAPQEIYLPCKIENELEVLQFLTQKLHGPTIKIQTPQRGEKKRILDLAAKNAKHFAQREEVETLSKAENFSKALPELAEALGLETPPKRMECFDVSHLGGTCTVASQVVFVDGLPKNKEYRRFKIKTLPEGKIDDFAAMEEILTRRFKRKDDEKYAEKFPDLIVIDGGKGQLSSVMKSVKTCQEENTFPENFNPEKQIIALAKQEEEIFRPGQKEALLLKLNSAPLKLLQRIRDEAHRFAITYNRAMRSKKMIKSVLDGIPGIGSATKSKLLKTFGSVSGIKKADGAKLREVLSAKQIESLKKFL